MSYAASDDNGNWTSFDLYDREEKKSYIQDVFRRAERRGIKRKFAAFAAGTAVQIASRDEKDLEIGLEQAMSLLNRDTDPEVEDLEVTGEYIEKALDRFENNPGYTGSESPPDSSFDINPVLNSQG